MLYYQQQGHDGQELMKVDGGTVDSPRGNMHPQIYPLTHTLEHNI